MTNEKFTAVLNQSDITINGINEFLGLSKDIDIDLNCKYARIDFSVEPEAREWGIKGITIMVHRVNLSFDWETWTEDLTDKDRMDIARLRPEARELRNGRTEETIHWIIEGDNITSELKFSEGGALHITDLVVDLKTKTAVVESNY
jgi:hypothetical protein